MPPVNVKAHINEHGNVIADAIADILSKALPAHVIPPKLRFSYENVPACDAEILNVYCEFEAAGFLFSLHFELDTDRGGNRFFLEPKPRSSVDGASLTYEGMDEDFAAARGPRYHHVEQALVPRPIVPTGVAFWHDVSLNRLDRVANHGLEPLRRTLARVGEINLVMQAGFGEIGRISPLGRKCAHGAYGRRLAVVGPGMHTLNA